MYFKKKPLSAMSSRSGAVVEAVLRMDRSGHVKPNLLIDLCANRAFGDSQVEVGLQPEPELGRDAKVFAQSERSVCGDSTLPIDDIADAPWWDSDIPGEPINANAHRLHKFFQKDLPWMNRLEPFLARHMSSLMVVNYLNVVSVTVSPEETDAPPVIDADAILTPAVAFKRFQAIAWRNQQVLKGSSAVEIHQLPASNSLKGSEARLVQVGEQCFRFLGSKGSDHRRPVYYAPRNSSNRVTGQKPVSRVE
jgi:hypothetical protein